MVYLNYKFISSDFIWFCPFKNSMTFWYMKNAPIYHSWLRWHESDVIITKHQDLSRTFHWNMVIIFEWRRISPIRFGDLNYGANFFIRSICTIINWIAFMSQWNAMAWIASKLIFWAARKRYEKIVNFCHYAMSPEWMNIDWVKSLTRQRNEQTVFDSLFFLFVQNLISCVLITSITCHKIHKWVKCNVLSTIWIDKWHNTLKISKYLCWQDNFTQRITSG